MSGLPAIYDLATFTGVWTNWYQFSNPDDFSGHEYKPTGRIIVPYGDIQGHYLVIGLDLEFGECGDIVSLGEVYVAFMVNLCPPQDYICKQLQGYLWLQKIDLRFLHLELVEGYRPKIIVKLDQDFQYNSALLSIPIQATELGWQYEYSVTNEFGIWGNFYLGQDGNKMIQTYDGPPEPYLNNGKYSPKNPYVFMPNDGVKVNLELVQR